jgi:hypothetical protein
MEADFNTANKIIFRTQMLSHVGFHHHMPGDIFSKKQHQAEDGILAKTLFYEKSRQMNSSAALTSINAANFYDCIAHAIVSLVLQALWHQCMQYSP